MVLFFFVIGCVFGSFAGVLIDHLPTSRSILKVRSICESCHKKLRWFELIPLASFLLQKGKCRRCHARIPLRVFIVELVTGTLFALFAFFVIPQIPIYLSILFLIMLFCLIVIFFTDWEYGIIPDVMLVILAISSLLYSTSFGLITLLTHVAVGIGSFIVFLALFLATKGRGIGFGDVKFVGVIGIMLGLFGLLISLYFAFLTGAVISLILIVVRRKKFRKDTIAFGPFLVLGIGVFAIYHNELTAFLKQFGL